MRSILMGTAIAVALTSAGCDDDEVVLIPENFEELDIAVCDPANGPFTPNVDNKLFPLPPGTTWFYEGLDTDGTFLEVEVVARQETEEIAGIETQVVEVTEFADGELAEISFDFYAQAPDGTVCYYGEEVDVFEDGIIVGHPGEWRADGPGNRPGILIPGNPRDQTVFFQERAPQIAEDRSAILDDDVEITVRFGSFDDVLWTIDWNPLDGETSADGDEKFYVNGIGLVADGPIELVGVSRR